MASVVLQVDRRRGDLFNYIIFLRVTPILPNIFINIASPVVDVPLRPFALGVMLHAALVCPSQSDIYQLSVLALLAEHMISEHFASSQTPWNLAGVPERAWRWQCFEAVVESVLLCMQPRSWGVCQTIFWPSMLAASWGS